MYDPAARINVLTIQEQGWKAMTVATAKKMTFEEYLTYEDDSDRRYEFNDGELVSPTCRSVDTVEKRKEYTQVEIPEYWIVDFLMGTFSVLSLVNGSYIERVYREENCIASDIFPSISLSMSQVMASI